MRVRDNGRQRCQLLFNPLKYVWRLKMIPYASTEVVYSVRFAWMMLRATSVAYLVGRLPVSV